MIRERLNVVFQKLVELGSNPIVTGSRMASHDVLVARESGDSFEFCGR